jgi:hypothetical protein
MLEPLFVGLGGALFFGVFLAFLAFMRYLRYKETIELAKQGILRSDMRRGGRETRRSLRWGIILTVMGIIMTCGLATIGLDPYNQILGPWLLGGLIPLGFGISFLLIDRMANTETVMETAEIHFEDDPIPPHKQ